MHGRGKSDGPVVPAKPPNNATPVVAAEVVEERGPAKGNAVSETRPGRRAGVSVCKVSWVACAQVARLRTGMRDSPRSCTT